MLLDKNKHIGVEEPKIGFGLSIDDYLWLGDYFAVDDLNLKVAEGEIFGFLGQPDLNLILFHIINGLAGGIAVLVGGVIVTISPGAERGGGMFGFRGLR